MEISQQGESTKTLGLQEKKYTSGKGWDKLKEKIKRRKDQGFTLIELMIVIAVIGILAIVLVPKVGTIKTQAKGAGIDTNVRMVQGYLQSKISKWAEQGVSQNTVASDVYNAFNKVDGDEKNQKSI